MQKLSVGILLVVGLTALMLIGLVGVASAANSAVPGDALYGVDRGLETLSLQLVANPGAAEQLQDDFIQERLSEINALAQRGDAESLAQALAMVSQVLGEAQADVGDDVDDGDDGDDGEDGDDDDGEDGEGFKQPKDSPHCTGTATAHHPAGDKLAEDFGAEYSDIMDRFCEGYGFGEIALAYRMAQQLALMGSEWTVDDLFDLRAQGMGWGNVMREAGLKGNSGKDPTTGLNPNSNKNKTKIQPNKPVNPGNSNKPVNPGNSHKPVKPNKGKGPNK